MNLGTPGVIDGLNGYLCVVPPSAVVLDMVRNHLDEIPGDPEGPDGEDGDLGISSARAKVLDKGRDYLDEVLAALGAGAIGQRS